MKNRDELKPLGGFDKSIDIPLWVGVIFVIGAVLVAPFL